VVNFRVHRHFNYFLQVARKKNTFALTKTIWLNYVGYFTFVARLHIVLLKMISKIVAVIREHPGFREKVILLRKDFKHAHQIPCKQILARNTLYTWEHVNFLPRMKLG
jgi:hypothetical protein